MLPTSLWQTDDKESLDRSRAVTYLDSEVLQLLWMPRTLRLGRRARRRQDHGVAGYLVAVSPRPSTSSPVGITIARHDSPGGVPQFELSRKAACGELGEGYYVTVVRTI